MRQQYNRDSRSILALEEAAYRDDPSFVLQEQRQDQDEPVTDLSLEFFSVSRPLGTNLSVGDFFRRPEKLVIKEPSDSELVSIIRVFLSEINSQAIRDLYQEVKAGKQPDLSALNQDTVKGWKTIRFLGESERIFDRNSQFDRSYKLIIIDDTPSDSTRLQLELCRKFSGRHAGETTLEISWKENIESDYCQRPKRWEVVRKIMESIDCSDIEESRQQRINQLKTSLLNRNHLQHLSSRVDLHRGPPEYSPNMYLMDPHLANRNDLVDYIIGRKGYDYTDSAARIMGIIFGGIPTPPHILNVPDSENLGKALNHFQSSDRELTHQGFGFIFYQELMLPVSDNTTVENLKEDFRHLKDLQNEMLAAKMELRQAVPVYLHLESTHADEVDRALVASGLALPRRSVHSLVESAKYQLPFSTEDYLDFSRSDIPISIVDQHEITLGMSPDSGEQTRSVSVVRSTPAGELAFVLTPREFIGSEYDQNTEDPERQNEVDLFFYWPDNSEPSTSERQQRWKMIEYVAEYLEVPELPISLEQIPYDASTEERPLADGVSLYLQDDLWLVARTD